MVFSRFIIENGNWENKLVHIKYEINTAFYQIIHENCDENHNFCQILIYKSF